MVSIPCFVVVVLIVVEEGSETIPGASIGVYRIYRGNARCNPRNFIFILLNIDTHILTEFCSFRFFLLMYRDVYPA